MEKLEEFWSYLKEGNPYIEEYNVISNGRFTCFTLSCTDSSVLDYLMNNKFPVVYSSILDGIIVLKF
jgi:hypothetical protein